MRISRSRTAKGHANAQQSSNENGPDKPGRFGSAMASADQANGSCSTMVWSRSGPVETIEIGQPASSSSARR